MIETGETTGDQPNNTIVFCEKAWRLPSAILAFFVLLTFTWGIYILNSYGEDDFFHGSDDLSVSQFLTRNVAMPDVQRLYYTVPPAVVGIGNGGVNASPSAAGAIVGANGYVVTALHSVANLPQIDVQVFTPTGVRRFPAQVVKTIPAHDLVLLKMQTAEKFMFFRMGNSQMPLNGQSVFAFGRNMGGASVVRQGLVQSSNMALNINGVQITHLLRSDAVYSWEQNGGPLVNAQGELVGINIAVQGAGGMVEGFTIPAQVVIAHFQDIVTFKMTAQADTPTQMGTVAQAQVPNMVPAAANSAAWWAKARTAAGVGPMGAAGVGPGMGMNLVQGAPPPITVPGALPGTGFLDTDHAGRFTIAGYSLSDAAGLMILALAAGVTGGMMTMGGGVLQVAGMMVFFGYGMYLIRPVAFLTNVAVYGASAWRNNKSGLVQWDTVIPLVPWGVAGVVFGYFIGNAIGDGVVGLLLGLFAMLMAAKAVMEILHPDTEPDAVSSTNAANDDDLDGLVALADGRPSGKADEEAGILGLLNGAGGVAKAAILGLPMGLISGILGISGGVIEVPLQRYVGKISLQNAIANSSVLVFWASVAGSVVAFLHGTSTGLIHWQAPVTLSLLMIPGAYLGGLLGAQLMRVLPVQTLKGIYALTMAAIAIKMLLK